MIEKILFSLSLLSLYINKTIYFQLKTVWYTKSDIIRSMNTKNLEIKSFCERCLNDWKTCNFTTPLLKICRDINKNSAFDSFIKLVLNLAW